MSYLGESIAKLGFGLMRLPEKDGGIDINQTIEMADLFIDNGFTYFDSAYGYYEGKSEEAAKTVLFDRYPREKFTFATKLPAFEAESAEAAKQMFWTSLKRTGAEYFDFYLLHNLGSVRTQPFYDYGMWDFMLELKEKGVVRHIGFSIHSKADHLDDVLTKHPEMEFVQLQINYSDWENEYIQSRKCYEVARKHNKPIVIMEPVKGGMLAGKLPPKVREVFDETGTNASYASWAIRFAASLGGVITVLSGMSSLEQMSDNIGFMKDFQPLSDDEYNVIARARKTLEALPSIPCTACEYCKPVCPEGIVIPDILDMMNREVIYGDPVAAKGGYDWEILFGGKASDCTGCGSCEQICPQGLAIPDLLKEAAAKYE